MNILVRKAVCEDSSAMSETVCSSWKYAYKGIVSQDYLDKLTPERWKDKFYKGIAEGVNSYNVMEYDGRIIGVALISNSTEKNYPNDAELVCFYLMPDYIGKGLGQIFFDRVLDFVTAKGYKNIILDVLCENTRAVHFYKKQGFEILDNSVEVPLDDNVYLCNLMRMKLC